MPPIQVQLDTQTVIGILTLFGVVFTAVFGAIGVRRSSFGTSLNGMADAQGKLEQQVADLNKRVNRLYDDNGNLRGLLRDYRRRDIEQVEYIRNVGHWMSEACQAMHVDAKWADTHPKPHLPESIRQELPPERRHIDTDTREEKQ